MLSDERINANFSIFVKKLKECNVECDILLNEFGDKIKMSPGTSNSDAGLAYPGAMVNYVLRHLTPLALKINELFSDTIKVDDKSLIKVCLLHQIAKGLIFVEETEKWKRDRGNLYTFADLDGALKCGERSALMCLNSGIKLTCEEFEAIRILDKDASDEQAKYFSSPLAILVKTANEIAMLEIKKEIKK
jgi:hypothetical protein